MRPKKDANTNEFYVLKVLQGYRSGILELLFRQIRGCTFISKEFLNATVVMIAWLGVLMSAHAIDAHTIPFMHIADSVFLFLILPIHSLRSSRM